MFSFRLQWIAAALLLIPGAVVAQTLTIRPALVDSSDQVEAAVQRNEGQASTSLRGAGKTLLLTYSSDEQIEVFMVPLDTNGNYVPMDFMRFTLPATKSGEVRIDLTVSPGWTPGENLYLLNMLSKTKEPNAYFVDAQFEAASFVDVLKAGIGHFLTVEPFTPSTYHALRGYRTLSMSVSVLLGVLSLILAIIAYILSKPEKKLKNVIAVFLVLGTLYATRFSVDLLRITKEHLVTFEETSTYDEAGASSLIASSLRDVYKLTQNDSVFVCRDGTNFKEKLIRYYAYPIPIVSEAEKANDADYVLVMDKFDWSYVPGKKEIGKLSCDPLKNVAAEKVAEFPDKAVLFHIK